MCKKFSQINEEKVLFFRWHEMKGNSQMKKYICILFDSEPE
jgi:hypothetical protein